MNLVLLGPPGAGKGTQAKVLSKELKIRHISTGDILRDAVRNKTALGKETQEYMTKGELVPDRLVIAIVKETLQGNKADSGFILDGFPRTLEQATMLDETLEGIGKKLDVVIFLKTSLETSIARLNGRRVCKGCDTIYHIKNIPPKKEGVCDQCGNSLYQRKDDQVDTIKRRWSVYNKDTTPLIKYYTEKNILKEVSGDLDVDRLNTILMALFQKESLI